jgi:hypothetical protein
MISDKKSVATIMEKPFTDYSMLILDEHMNKRVNNTSYTVEESAGWTRGGSATRDMASDEYLKQANRPNAESY